MNRDSGRGRFPCPWPIVLCVLLLGAGCGGGDAPADDALQEALEAADEVNPCILLTAAEIDSITGFAPGEPEPETFEDALMCLWPRADDIDVQLVNVVITAATADTYEQYLENSESLLGYRATPAQAQLVAGPGRFAVWIPDGDAGTFQFFVTGHMIQVVAGAAGERTALETCRALAEVIDRRLP